MQEQEQSIRRDEARITTLVWAAAMVILAVVLVALFGGAAYTGVQQARLTAASASLGHIEAVLTLAEREAEQAGLGMPPASYAAQVKSYDENVAALPTYERYILEVMLDTFGPARSFDFAVTRFEDSTGIHTYVYYFPQKGQTQAARDRYYVSQDGVVSEKNA